MVQLRRTCTHFVFGLCLVTIMSALTTSCGLAEPTISSTQNPLVAQYNVGVRGAAQAWVEFGPDTTYGRQTSAIAKQGIPFTTVSILVAGMKQSTTYHMRAHVQWSDGTSWVDQDHTFTTGVIPASLQPPKITVRQPNSNLSPAPGVELLSNNGQLEGVVTDLAGNIIWYCPGFALPLKPLPNGHFLVNTKTDLQEVDLGCTVIRDVSVEQLNQSLQSNGYDFTIASDQDLPSGGQLHHEVLPLPNGHWIALCEVAKSFTDAAGYPGTVRAVGDGVLDIDPNGNVVWAWNSFDHLDIQRHLMGLPDWTHSNALVYTPDGNLLISMRAQSWVLKLDYENGKGSGNILWKLGNEGDFTLVGEDSSQWFYAQHYPNLLGTNGSQMILAIYDDGNLRPNADGALCGATTTSPPCYSRATIFQIDESTKLATLLWADLPGFYSFWGGSIDVLSNGDIEFDNSEPFPAPRTSASQILEVTPTNTPETVWQMTISGENAYRGYRMPSLYPGVTWTN